MAEEVSSIAIRRRAARSDGGVEYLARRAEIVQAATEVFREKGYAAASVHHVAVRLGADRASLYYYVSGKLELFQECMHEALSENIRDADAIAASGMSPKEKLTALIAVLIRSQERYYPTMFVYLQENLGRLATEEESWAQRMMAETRRFERYFVDTIRQGVEQGAFRSGLSPTLIANAVFGMTQWTHRWWVPERRYGSQDVIDAFTAVLFEGTIARL